MNLVGIRYQSVSNDINGGSLFLLGTPPEPPLPPTEIPEPATLALFGPALAGLGALRRRFA